MSKYLLSLVAILSSVSATHAQAPACLAPAILPDIGATGLKLGPRNDLPIGGYRLALSWSPEYCRNRGGEDDRLQCGPAAIGRFGFVLHGLWPQGKGSRWPQYCRAVSPVPEPVVRETLCISPSVRLIQHEWAKHGSCMARSPDGYFRAARILFQAYRAPDMMALSRGPLTVAGLQQGFARRNPGLKPQAVSVKVNRRGWLEEVGICLDVQLRNRPCPPWEKGADAGQSIKIWRGR